MTKSILWLRTDLRTYDHEALHRACSESSDVLPVYVFDPETLQGEAFGYRRMGVRRLRFITECLADLKNGLEELGATLVVLHGRSKDVIPALAAVSGASRVWVHTEVASEELKEERAVEAALPTGCKLERCWGHSLYHIDDLPLAVRQIPEKYTEFRKLVEKYSVVRRCFPAPEKVSCQMNDWRRALDAAKITWYHGIPTLAQLGFPEVRDHPKAVMVFKGGEKSAWDRLNHYFWDTQCLATYKETRNGMLGADYSSKFSPWLSQGCISPRAIYHEVSRFEQEVKKNQSTYWLIFELIWRDYFRFIALKHGDALFRPGGFRSRHMQPAATRPAILEPWAQGRTGIPLVDANMLELQHTGFMSNRGRQNVASFLVKDLRQNWQAGAAYFEQELLDYDVASNWGNWTYVAGVGNDPREDRYFNILTQAERYDPHGDYVAHWIPELKGLRGMQRHTPWLAGLAALTSAGLTGTVYAKPIHVPPQWKL
jgi:deoxyribodipyrimidine photo-lyase